MEIEKQLRSKLVYLMLTGQVDKELKIVYRLLYDNMPESSNKTCNKELLKYIMETPYYKHYDLDLIESYIGCDKDYFEIFQGNDNLDKELELFRHKSRKFLDQKGLRIQPMNMYPIKGKVFGTGEEFIITGETICVL